MPRGAHFAAMRLAAITLAAVLAATAARAETIKVTCSIDFGPDRPCTLVSDDSGRAGPFREKLIAGRRVVNLATIDNQSGWHTVTIDGRPGMAYELNRGHWTMATTDLKHFVEYRYPGY